MGTYSWRDTQLSYERHNVHSSSAKLALHRLYSNPEGVPVFMVHGAGGSADSFIQREQGDAGLAPFLASHGFDVYVAELSHSTDLECCPSSGVHQLILDEIPAQLAAVAKRRPSVPQFWIGHGLGSVLLASCYARLDILPTPVLGMVHLAAGRRCELSSLSKSLRYMARQGICSLGGLIDTHKRWLPGSGMGRELISDYGLWQQDSRWLDPVDQMDYRQAIQRKGLPPGLYLSTVGNPVTGGLEDTRLWVQELGQHNARIICVAKSCGNLRNYSYNSILSRPEACGDHFLQLLDWLQELGGRATEMERCTA